MQNMEKVSGDKEVVRIEELFETATDAVSHLEALASLWMKKWMKNKEVASNDFLLLRMCGLKGLLDKVIPLLPTNGKYAKYTLKIKSVFFKNTNLLGSFFEEKERFLVALDEMGNTLKHTHKILLGVRGLFADHYEDEDETTLFELVLEEIDFLLPFSDAFYFLRECAVRNIDTGTLLNTFNGIEALFKKNFYMFEHIQGVLSAKTIALPLKEEWWLSEKPDEFRKDLGYFCSNDTDGLLSPERISAINTHLVGCRKCSKEVKKIKKFENFLKEASKTYREALKKPRRDCPCDNMLFAYAVDKTALSAKVVVAIDQHAKSCFHCIDQIIEERVKFTQVGINTKE